MAKDEESDDEYLLQAFKESAAFRRASFHPPEEIWNIFVEAEDCCDITDYFRALIKLLNIDPNLHGIDFFEVLKSKLTSWKCQSLWDLLNARLKQSEYKQGKIAKDEKCIIIGAGPIGLRTAIETLLLGCRTVIVEKRKEFSRNNVLHLWPFLLTDFRALGAKKFYGKFGAGCIDHINIKTLQCILLKICLILGVEIHLGVQFKHLVEPTDVDTGWRAKFEPENHELSKYTFDIVLGADGKKNVLPGFPQIELRGALAIGITCNFVNNNTIEEAAAKEISGVSYQFNPSFFNDMEAQYGVKLENIVYYKNETHYFVMTALKKSLLRLEVIAKDSSDPKLLLHPSNIDKEKLIEFTRAAVNYATNHELPLLDFKMLSNGNPDIALFDFTSIKKAANASRIIERKKHKLLIALVGDSLIEPFWPTGSGCGRGVLSALDVAWMVHQFALKLPPLAILRERENVFKLLSVTNNDSLQKNYSSFTINPKTRYSSFDTKRVSNMTSLKGLYDTDDQENADFTIASPVVPSSTTKKTPARRRPGSGSGSVRKVSLPSSHLHHHQNPANRPKRKSDRAVLKDQALVGNTKSFWEDHNKKNLADRETCYVPKKKVSAEEPSDSDHSVYEDEPIIKKGFAREISKDKSRSLKQQASRDELKALKRQPSKDELRTNKSRKGVFHSKGGGLKKRSISKTPDKSDITKTKQKTTSLKKSVKQLEETTKTQDTAVVKKEPPRPVDARNFFRKWLDNMKLKANSSETVTDDDDPQALHTCIQTAAITVMAIPLSMDCNHAPRRRTTDLKLKELQIANENFLSVSNNRKESKEISLSRLGSVKKTIAKYKMMAQKDGENDNYYEFLKQSRNDTAERKNKLDGIELVEGFAPKDVIDVEKALLDNEKEEKNRSRISKVTASLLNKLLCLFIAAVMFIGIIVTTVHFILNT